jgi:hypothetical protein
MVPRGFEPSVACQAELIGRTAVIEESSVGCKGHGELETDLAVTAMMSA